MNSKVIRRLFIGAGRALTIVAATTVATPSWAKSEADNPIRIGGLTFLSGRYSSYGAQAERGVKLAIDKINASGGVLGKPVTVDLEDTASDSGQAVSLLRRFAASSDVAAVIGPSGTPDLLAILPIASQLTVPILSIGSQKTLAQSQFPDHVFRMCLVETPEVLRDIVKKVAAAKHIRHLGVFVDRSNDSSQAESKSLETAVGMGTGVDIVANESYTGGDKDFSVEIGKMLRAGVDAIYLSGTTNEDVIIIPQARARGFKGVFLGGATLEDPKIVQVVGPSAAPYVMFTPFNAMSDRTVVKEFVAAYQRAYGKDPIAAYAAYAYDAVMLVNGAIRRVGSTDRAKIALAIGTTRGFQGVTGDYSYAGKGDNTTPLPYIMEFRPNGTFTPLE